MTWDIAYQSWATCPDLSPAEPEFLPATVRELEVPYQALAHPGEAVAGV